MRICRLALGTEVFFGVIDSPAGTDPELDSPVVLLKSHPFGDLEPEGRTVTIADITLLAPILPSKIIGVGKNYADHAIEMGGELPKEPLIFLKPNTSVIGPGDTIKLPKASSNVHHEAELAVVIGRFCKDVSVEDAPRSILGYTCANDVTARDIQQSDGQWTRGKSFDSFAPIGPWIETSLDPSNLTITAHVGNELRQSGSTNDLVFGVNELVSFISHHMTLLPGDVILTGTPAGVGPILPGDEVDIDIEGIGSLVNYVEAVS